MKTFLSLLLILGASAATGQNLSGKWTGDLPQRGRPTGYFSVEMEIAQMGNTITGKAKYTTPNNDWVVELFTGHVTGSKIQIDENKVENDSHSPGWGWCLKNISAIFSIDPVTKAYKLDGAWKSTRSYDVDHANYGSPPCEPGEIHLIKTKPSVDTIEQKAGGRSPASVSILGKWSGYNMNGDVKWDTEVNIDRADGDQLSGRVRVNNSGKQLETTFTGIKIGDKITIEEIAVKDANWPEAQWEWILKQLTGSVKTDMLNEQDVLTGDWVSVKHVTRDRGIFTSSQGSGTFYLTKAHTTPIKKSLDNKNGITKPGTQEPKPFERPQDGYFKKSNIFSAKVTPYAPLREADVWMAKRVWQEMDLREKMNNYLGSPKARLIDVLFDAVNAGELTAYDPDYKTKEDPDGDGFSKPLKPGEARGRLAGGANTTKNKLDADGNVIGTIAVAAEFNPDSIIRFRIKEDWIFDKQRSVWEPRIIGIAPLVKPKAVAGVDLDYVPAFWIYYPEARQVLATKEVSSKYNDATGLSFDDIFMKRIYASYIVKESNDKNERIKDYAQGIDRLYESQRIKKSLMDWELDLWQY